jgi:hypothetical protein
MPSSKSRSASKRRTPKRSNRSRVPMNEVFEMPSSSIFNRVSRWLTRKNKSKSKSPRVLSIGQYSPRPKGGSRKNRTRRHSRKH